MLLEPTDNVAVAARRLPTGGQTPLEHAFVLTKDIVLSVQLGAHVQVHRLVGGDRSDMSTLIAIGRRTRSATTTTTTKVVGDDNAAFLQLPCAQPKPFDLFRLTRGERLHVVVVVVALVVVVVVVTMIL